MAVGYLELAVRQGCPEAAFVLATMVLSGLAGLNQGAALFDIFLPSSRTLLTQNSKGIF